MFFLITHAQNVEGSHFCVSSRGPQSLQLYLANFACPLLMIRNCLDLKQHRTFNLKIMHTAQCSETSPTCNGQHNVYIARQIFPCTECKSTITTTAMLQLETVQHPCWCMTLVHGQVDVSLMRLYNIHFSSVLAKQCARMRGIRVHRRPWR